MLFVGKLSKKLLLFRNLITVVPMPRLSPTNTGGIITKWHVEENSTVTAYELICDIDGASVVETKVNSLSTLTPMELEIQEDGIVAKLLYSEGPTLIPCGKPIAILCEQKEELFEALEIAEKLVDKDVYEQSDVEMAGWQAYVKSSKDSNSCG